MTEVINETDYEINEAEFSALADYVLDQMHVSSDAEVNIIFIEPEPMEDLHVRWLDLPGPTDVMSFPMDELRPGTADRPTPPGMLGDIDDIEFCHLTSADVVRHELVGAIIDAYQRFDDRNAARRARTRSHNTARREYTS